MELALAVENEHFDQVVDRSYDQQGVDCENDCVGHFVLVQGHVDGYWHPDNRRTDKGDQGADDRQSREQKHRRGSEEIVSDAGREPLGDGRKDRRKNDGSRCAIEFRQEFLFVAIVQGAQVHEGTDHRGPIAQKEIKRYKQDGKPDEEFDHEGDRTASEADQMGLKVSQQVIEVLSDLFRRRIGNFLEDPHEASSR